MADDPVALPASVPVPMNDDPAAIPWWKSQVLRRIAGVVLMQVIGKVGGHLTQPEVGQIIDLVFDGLSTAFAIWAAHARIKSPTPVIVSNLNKASEINIAAAAAKSVMLNPPPAPPPEA